MAQQYSATCPGTTPPSSVLADNIEKDKSLIGVLGINSCKTHAESHATDFAYSSGGMMGKIAGGAEGRGHTEDAYKDTVGCGSLNVLLQNHIQTVNTVTCILTSVTSSESTTTSAVNSITFEGDVSIDCGKNGLNLNQSASVEMTVVNKIDQSVMEKIQTAVQSGVKAFTNGISEGATGPAYGPDGQGTQTIKTINEQNSTQNSLDNITQIVNKIINNTMAGNSLVIGSPGGHLNITGDGCKFDQETHIHIIATNIVDTAFSIALKNVDLSTIMPVPPAPPKKNTNIILLVVGLVFILLVCGGIYYYYTRKPIGKPIVPFKSPIVPVNA